jgi:superfamily II DNA helicase RecQ
MMDAKVFKASFNRPNLYYEIRPKLNVLKEMIKFVRNIPENPELSIASAVRRWRKWLLRFL